jgi:hypothetical protein
MNSINPNGSNLAIGGSDGLVITPGAQRAVIGTTPLHEIGLYGNSAGALTAVWNGLDFYPSTANQGNLGYFGGNWNNIYVNNVNAPTVNATNVNTNTILSFPIIGRDLIENFVLQNGTSFTFNLPAPAFPGTVLEAQLSTTTGGGDATFSFGSNVSGNPVTYGYYSYVFRNRNAIGGNNLVLNIKRNGSPPIGSTVTFGNTQLSPGEKFYTILLIEGNTILDFIIYNEAFA